MPKPAHEALAAIRAVKKLLQASGYQILERLQTQEPGVDRLIAVFDLVAYTNGNVLALEFKGGDASNSAVSWTEAASLHPATWAIFKALERFGTTVHNVRPVLVLVGQRADETLKTFCEEQSIHLVEIQDRKLIDDILTHEFSDDELRQRARSILRLRIPSGTQPQAVHSEPERG